jgi:hypothetical protein
MTYPGNGPCVYFHDLWPSSISRLMPRFQPPTIGPCLQAHKHASLARCPLHYPLHDIVSTCIRNVMPRRMILVEHTVCTTCAAGEDVYTVSEALERPCSTAAGLARSTLHVGEQLVLVRPRSACSPCRTLPLPAEAPQ